MKMAFMVCHFLLDITEYIETRGIDIIKDLKLAALNLVLIANQYVLVYRTNNNLFYNRYTKSERRSQINKAEQVKENYKEEEE